MIKSVIILWYTAGVSAWALDAVPPDHWLPGDSFLADEGGHQVYALWPGDGRRADDANNTLEEMTDGRRITNVARPTVTVMRPAQPNGVGVLVFPGGGYKVMAAGHEGREVGEWLNNQGITAFVVKYRVPRRDGVNVGWQDGQRALRLVRLHAELFGVEPQRLGVLGFSAGGHLCASIAHRFAEAAYPPADEIDAVDARPNFAVLIYPAYLGKFDKVDQAFSVVPDNLPPIYIAVSKNDNHLPSGWAYAQHLTQAKADCEFHVYTLGKHGTGLGGFPWVTSCVDWLGVQIKTD